MAEPIDKDIEIKDLPAEDILTPEEKELLAGAGRPSFRPSLEAFEARELMSVTPLVSAAPPDLGATMKMAAPTPTAPMFVMPGGVSQGSATVIDLNGRDLTKMDLSGKDLSGAKLTSGNVTGVDPAAAATTVETPAANLSSDQQDIRQKLEQIQQVAAILEAMDVPDLSYAQWLDGQSQKNQELTATDATELKLKQSEIHKLQSQPEKANILADDEAELAIMKDKMAKMIDLQTAIEQAQQGQPGADQRVADLTLEISQDELNLKKQQVTTLKDQLKISPPDKQPALQQLLEGEKYEVEQLKQIHSLNKKIAHLVGKGGDADSLADLRRRVVHHELLMKEQNMRQLEARLKTGEPAAQGAQGSATGANLSST